MTTTFPKTPGACVDLYYKMRTARIEDERKIEERKKEEAKLASHICRLMHESGSTGLRGKVANFTVETVYVPTARDWAATWEYIRKNKAFHLVQRRLSDTAVREIWDAGKEVPGVDKFETTKIHCVKVGGK